MSSIQQKIHADGLLKIGRCVQNEKGLSLIHPYATNINAKELNEFMLHQFQCSDLSQLIGIYDFRYYFLPILNLESPRFKVSHLSYEDHVLIQNAEEQKTNFNFSL